MVFVLQRTLQVSSEYYTVAAVSRQSLAVGYRFGRGIDLINMEGQVLCQICMDLSMCWNYVDEDDDGVYQLTMMYASV
ncbi:hypothetical protein PoB_001850500 [Plakobranchus ocellatus]|uniref:Uncharacterized protein n=1 Tax=Plakobranchus ocellatus TaxID=259542 RepID=A0AAV3Z8Z5_9GAST|nr:hypothetical protein PoB_001850500 [Plakobranchus ocellatus]